MVESLRSENNQLNARVNSDSDSFNQQKSLLSTRLEELDLKVKDLEAQEETLSETIKNESQAKVSIFVKE